MHLWIRNFCSWRLKINRHYTNLPKKIWYITDKEEASVVETDTQLNGQSNDSVLSRNFSTNDCMLRYQRIKSYCYTDTILVTKSAKSIWGHLYLQVFVSYKDYVAIYPMKLKTNFKDYIYLLCKEVGVLIALIVYPSGEQTSKAVRKFCNQAKTTLWILEESTQWANCVELHIGLLKKAIRKDLHNSKYPMVLWIIVLINQTSSITLPHVISFKQRNSLHMNISLVQGDISTIC